MKRIIAVLTLAAFVAISALSHAAQKTSGDILMEGLLGAGAGAVGGAASGAKTKDLWKGALAGAGVNIVGGAIIDSVSGEKVANTSEVNQMSPQNAFSDGYNQGYNNGFKQGYTEGFKEGVKSGATP